MQEPERRQANGFNRRIAGDGVHRLLVWGLLLVWLPIASSLSDPGGIEDSTWRDGWTVQAQAQADRFSWTATRDNETITGAFDPDARSLRFGLADHALSDVGFTLQAVVEFQDHDGDGRFSLGDPVIQQHRFDDLNLNRIVAHGEGGNHQFEARFWTWNGPTVVMTTTVDADQPTEFGVDLVVESYRFLSDNNTRLAIDLRIHDVLALDAGGLREQDGLVARYEWHNTTTGPMGVTFQPYGAGAGHQTILVFAHPPVAGASQHLDIGLLQREPARDDGFLEELSLANWRLWAIGVLVMGTIGLVSIARSISREH